MAKTQILKFTGDVDSKNKKWNNYSVKTAKTFTELEAKLTHNFISKMDLFTDTYADKFSFVFRGKFTKAIGDGIRYIETYGSQHVVEHVPVKSGESLTLVAPYELQERSEILKNYFRLKCSAKQNDILAGADIWVNPDEMFDFQRKKIGDVQRSLALYIYLMWHNILITDPWAGDHADFMLSYGVLTRLGAEWDETTEFVGEALKLIKERTAEEVTKEKQLKNVVTYSLSEWYPIKVKADAIKKRKQKPTAEITSAQLKKLYFTNKDVDPILSVCALARAINYHVDRMLTWTSENDSAFPGNNKTALKNYGKDKQNFQYFCRCKEEDLVILMNEELLRSLKDFANVSNRTETGAFVGHLHTLLKRNIIGLDGMPYGCIKIGSKYRYNHFLLYDKILTDEMGWRDFRMWTLHQGVLIGIRQHVPFCCLRISDLYMNPAAAEKVDIYNADEALA